MVLDFSDGLHEGEAVVQHEVGQHQGGRAAHPHGTVHQDPPCERRHETQLGTLRWAGGGWGEGPTDRRGGRQVSRGAQRHRLVTVRTQILASGGAWTG